MKETYDCFSERENTYPVIYRTIARVHKAPVISIIQLHHVYGLTLCQVTTVVYQGVVKNIVENIGTLFAIWAARMMRTRRRVYWLRLRSTNITFWRCLTRRKPSFSQTIRCFLAGSKLDADSDVAKTCSWSVQDTSLHLRYSHFITFKWKCSRSKRLECVALGPRC